MVAFNQRCTGCWAFGRVYEADDPLLKRSVAIKVPLRNRFGTDSDLASFLNEARHAAALDREGIVADLRCPRRTVRQT